VDAGPGQALRPRLDDAALAALGHEVGARLATAHVRRSSHGTVTFFPADGPSRAMRTLELDRHGNVLALLRWTTRGLDAAWLRLPDATWVRLEPRVTSAAPWGASDRLWRSERPDDPGRPLTEFESVDYARVDFIPTLAEPGALPVGAGAVVLNLLASLAADQGRQALRYAGPYPSEQLFLTLLESFEYPGTGDDPLQRFIAGELQWNPAPHERHFSGAGASPSAGAPAALGAYVQIRDHVEKVVWRGRTYHRADWRGVGRHAPRRIADTSRGIVCGLWALGEMLEEHLVLTADGDVREITATQAARESERLREAGDAIPGAVVAGITAVIAATSAPALSPFITEEMRSVHGEWGTVADDLLEIRDTTLRVSTRLRRAAAARLGASRDRETRAHVALAALTEMAMLAADTVRARAQARLLALDESTQTAALTSPPPPDPSAAARITSAVSALLAEAPPRDAPPRPG
jgi:hypothetical protein